MRALLLESMLFFHARAQLRGKVNISSLSLSDGRKKTTHFNGWMNCVKSLSAPRCIFESSPLRRARASQFDLNNHLITLKQLRPEFSRIHSQVLQMRARNAALNILARGRGIGQELPKFRSVEDKASSQPRLVEHVYPVKQEASLLVGR